MRYPFLVLLFAFCTTIYAQESFLKKDLLVNIGVSLIPYAKHNFENSDPALKSLPLSFSVEYGVSPRLSVGVFVGYYSRTFRFLDSLPNEAKGSRVFKSRYLPLGIKGTFHFTELLERSYKRDLYSEDLDFYFSGMIGYRYNFLNHASGTEAETKNKLVFGAVLGIRYYWNYRFGFYAEVGPSTLGIVGLGITTRF